MKTNKLRVEFKKEHKIDAVQNIRNPNEPGYSLNYVHWLEDKLLLQWNRVEEKLPEDEINVLCYHEPSKNYFVCYRTLDCLTSEPKWFGGSMPTHWKFLDKPF